ncbi:MAG TPA: tetratricopeptide repeat protein [Terriglobia bacterium]|jgi:tetratricopeptide (TPR) repeat protein|nr:tetratricopeptide repeat protein [Terriglobia bacterium]
MIIGEKWKMIGAALLLLLDRGSAPVAAQVAGGSASQHKPAVNPGALSGDSAELAAEAQSALSKGDYGGAITSLERLAKLQPGMAEVHANLAVAYYSVGRYGDAVKQGREALTLKPSLVHAHFFLGASLAEGGQCKDALPYLEKDYTRATEPQLKRVLGTDAVRCNMVLNRPDSAVDFIRLLSRDFSDDPEVLYLSSQLYSELSTRASQRLLITAPGSPQAHQLNAEVLEMQEKPNEAEEEYRKVLALNPRAPGIHYRVGRLLLAGPRGPTTVDDARREFEEELTIDPSNAAAEYELGEMARQARQWDLAIEHFARAAQLEPEFTESFIGLGKSLVSAGRAQEAVAPLENAVKLEPQNPNAHYQLSFAYRRLGREQQAQAELAAYKETHEKSVQTQRAIRAGVLGDMSQPQSETPPE